MAEEITIDARYVEPPEPYELATTTLATLKGGQYVKMLIPRQPKILYLWLEQNGYDEETSQLSEDLFAIYIWEKDDQQTATEIMSIVVR